MSTAVAIHHAPALAFPRSDVLEASVTLPSGETQTVVAHIDERTTSTSNRLHMIATVTPVALSWTAAGETYTRRLDKVHATVFDLELEQRTDGAWRATFATIEDPILAEEVRGCGIASYAWSRLVEFGQRHAPEAAVGALKLAFVDAADDQDRDRRNSFYRRGGWTLVFADAEERAGRCIASSLSQLALNYPPNVAVTDTVSALARHRQELTLSRGETRRAREARARVESTNDERVARWRRACYVMAGVAVGAVGIALVL